LALNLASVCLLSGLDVALRGVPRLGGRWLGVTLRIAVACHGLLLRSGLRIRLAVVTCLRLLLGLGITLWVAAHRSLTAGIRHVRGRIPLGAPIAAVLRGRSALGVSLWRSLSRLTGLLSGKLLLRCPCVIRVELINRITCPPGAEITDRRILYRVPAGAA